MPHRLLSIHRSAVPAAARRSHRPRMQRGLHGWWGILVGAAALVGNLGASFTTTAVSAATLSRNHSERYLLNDAQDGVFQVSLFEAALIASRIDSAQHARLIRQHEQLVERARAIKAEALSDLDAARRIYRLMHRDVLTGKYRTDCTSLACSMNTGDFNCVSASVLYLTLARSCGIRVEALSTPSHVYCRIQPYGIDLQTTCRDWFEYMDRPDLQRAALERTPGYSPNAVPRHLSDVQLVGKVYYNRGVFQLNDERFEDAEQSFLMSLKLDTEDDAAKENLLATRNNWALDKCKNQDYREAAELVVSGLRSNAHYEPFRANDLHIHQRWAQSLCRTGDYQQACQLLETCQKRRPDATVFRDSRKAVYRIWIRALEREGRSQEARTIEVEAHQLFGEL